MPLDNLVKEIELVSSQAINAHSIFSMDLYNQLQNISLQLSAARIEDASAFNLFIDTHKVLLADLDRKALDYEMKYEEGMSRMMCNQLDIHQPDMQSINESRTKFIEFYRQLYEVEKGLLKPGIARICHVGCGPMPTSVLMWAKYSDCQITALDIDAGAVSQAQTVFDCWRKPKGVGAERVRFVCLPGEHFDYRGVDAIILSSSIMNKQNLFATIKQTITNTVDIIEREPNFLYEAGYLNTDKSHPSVIAKTTLANVNVLLYHLAPEL